jgi:hypothetical protein
VAANDLPTFNDWIEKRVAEHVLLGVSDFGALVSLLPGVYPTDVLEALRRLDTAPERNSGVEHLVQSSSRDASPQEWNSVTLGLPHPHPLDYEWRFGPEAVDLLAERCSSLTTSSASVALVATPTVAVAGSIAFGARPIAYFGADTALLTQIGLSKHVRKVVQVDLLMRNRSARRYGVVVMDPPWYEEHLLRFLWFGSSLTRLGGSILLAMPALGTRPGVADKHARCQT